MGETLAAKLARIRASKADRHPIDAADFAARIDEERAPQREAEAAIGLGAPGPVIEPIPAPDLVRDDGPILEVAERPAEDGSAGLWTWTIRNPANGALLARFPGYRSRELAEAAGRAWRRPAADPVELRFGNAGECRSCHAAVQWVILPSGKRCPLDLDVVTVVRSHHVAGLPGADAFTSVPLLYRPRGDGRVEGIGGLVAPDDWHPEIARETGVRSHFATCPQADQHRKRGTP